MKKTTLPDSKVDCFNPYSMVLIAYFILMAAVGVLIPENILKDYSTAREFSDLMAGIVPQIDKITALGIRPEVNRFYFSLLRAACPILLLIVISSCFSNDVRRNNFDGLKYSNIRLFCSWLAAIAMCLFGISMIYVDPSLKLTRFMLGSTAGRIIWGQLVFVTGPVFLLCTCLIVVPYSVLVGIRAGGRNIERQGND